MNIKRVVPDITSSHMEESLRFYAGFLGMKLAMDMGWIMTFISTSEPRAQVTVMQKTDSPVPSPAMSIEAENVDALHAKAVELGLPIVYPLTDEPWGVRRFFVKDPNDVIINVMSHL